MKDFIYQGRLVYSLLVRDFVRTTVWLQQRKLIYMCSLDLDYSFNKVWYMCV